MAENAYVDFIINNISAQVDFLLTQGVINASDARLIKLKLSNPIGNSSQTSLPGGVGALSSGLPAQPAPFNNSQTSLPTISRRASMSQRNKESPLPSPPGAPQAQQMIPTPSSQQPQHISHPPPPPPPQAPMPEPPQPALNKCIARWDYSGEASDLRLVKGDVISIIEEVNADWWKGRSESTGTEGLFPSNRVERIGTNPPLRNLPPAAPPSSTFGIGEKEKDVLPPTYNAPPGISYGAPTYSGTPTYAQPSQYYTPPAAPPAAGPSTYVQQPEDPKKNNKFKKLGSTMGNSFAGGVSDIYCDFVLLITKTGWIWCWCRCSLKHLQLNQCDTLILIKKHVIYIIFNVNTLIPRNLLKFVT